VGFWNPPGSYPLTFWKYSNLAVIRHGGSEFRRISITAQDSWYSTNPSAALRGLKGGGKGNIFLISADSGPILMTNDEPTNKRRKKCPNRI
jgi:hypothetical protein